MVSKEKNNPISLGEISTIRNILMGQQMNDYDNRFEGVLETLNALEAAMNEKVNALEKQTAARLSELQADVSQRFDKLEQLLTSNVETLNNKIDKVAGDDRIQMGNLFAEMSKRLLE